jgi:hypothetical protein
MPAARRTENDHYALQCVATIAKELGRNRGASCYTTRSWQTKMEILA